MSRRVLFGLAALLALGAGGWAVWAFGPEAAGGPQRVSSEAESIAELDTVALRRRVVTASVTGRVVGAESERAVLVADASGAISVRLGEDHGVRTGHTLLATGRLRTPRGGGARVLEARAWSVLEASAPPSTAGPDSVRFLPDSTRFGPTPDRSPEASDRSREGR